MGTLRIAAAHSVLPSSAGGLMDVQLSHSTAKRDRSEKKDIYEQAGVEEYWIVSPQGSVEIYYLKNGKYILEQNYMLQDDEKDEDYNANIEIILKGFPHIKMTLREIFDGVFAN